MTTYKCTQGFFTSKNKRYSYGDEISQSDYDGLDSKEQLKFEKKNSFSSSEDNSMFGLGKPGSLAMGDMLGTGIPGGVDGDFGTLL